MEFGGSIIVAKVIMDNAPKWLSSVYCGKFHRLTA
jgi:hypothetical protein